MAARTFSSIFVLLAATISADAQTRYPALEREPACQTLVPAAAGGPLPQNPDVVVLRFLGVSNYELAYKETVLLLDAAIDKLAWWAPNGVTPQDMTKRVHGIFIGHAHGEHLWDAPAIARQTGALVVGDPISIKWVRSTGLVPDTQTRAVTGAGGETFSFNGLTVEAVLGHHNIVPADYMAKDRAAAAAVTLRGGLTPEQAAHDKRLNSAVQTTADERARLIKEGTIAYFIRLDNGFRLFYTDSAGPTTDAERRIMQGVAGVDVGFIPYYGLELAPPITMEYVRLFKPAVMLPTHHDGHRNRMLDMPIGPFGLMVREEFPTTKVIAPLLRTPVCINTVTKELYVGQ
jgi:L-ascorbate metabolism protein UlaG (beta-lactamase superfamily)